MNAPVGGHSRALGGSDFCFGKAKAFIVTILIFIRALLHSPRHSSATGVSRASFQTTATFQSGRFKPIVTPLYSKSKLFVHLSPFTFFTPILLKDVENLYKRLSCLSCAFSFKPSQKRRQGNKVYYPMDPTCVFSWGLSQVSRSIVAAHSSLSDSDLTKAEEAISGLAKMRERLLEAFMVPFPSLQD